MLWFFEKYKDYDYYKFITQPQFILLSIRNYYEAARAYEEANK